MTKLNSNSMNLNSLFNQNYFIPSYLKQKFQLTNQSIQNLCRNPQAIQLSKKQLLNLSYSLQDLITLFISTDEVKSVSSHYLTLSPLRYELEDEVYLSDLIQDALKVVGMNKVLPYLTQNNFKSPIHYPIDANKHTLSKLIEFYTKINPLMQKLVKQTTTVELPIPSTFMQSRIKSSFRFNGGQNLPVSNRVFWEDELPYMWLDFWLHFNPLLRAFDAITDYATMYRQSPTHYARDLSQLKHTVESVSNLVTEFNSNQMYFLQLIRTFTYWNTSKTFDTQPRLERFIHDPRSSDTYKELMWEVFNV